MELVRDGQALTAYGAAHALPVPERLTLMLQVCRAVAYAHEHRILHCDLKPTNILVDYEGHPFVIDFGLARVYDEWVPGAALVSGGTPAYMSPEQVADGFGTLSVKTDVYALGLLLYEMLTGELPYRLPPNGSFAQLRQVITTAVPRPLHQYDVAYRGELEAIVAAALAKRPADRLSVAVLRSRLERYLTDLPSNRDTLKASPLPQRLRAQPQANLLTAGTRDCAERRGQAQCHAGLVMAPPAVEIATPPSLPPRSWRFGPFRLDPIKGRLWQGRKLVSLPPKPLAVLTYLVAHAGHMVTKAALLDAIGPETAATAGVLQTCLRQLRHVLAEPTKRPTYIATVHHRGYCFIAPVTVVDAPRAALRDPALACPPLLETALPEPIVMREAEMAQVYQRWTRVLYGERQLVFLTGEAGVGKTTLVEAFVAQVTATADIWYGRGQCIEQYGAGEAYLPLLEALGRLGRGPDGARIVELLRQHAPSWLLELPSLMPPAEYEMLQRRRSGATRHRMLRELAEMVEVLTVEKPLVLVLEDLHWSDPSTLEWLTYVARRRDRARLFILGTYRPADALLQRHVLRLVIQELRPQAQYAEVRLGYLTGAQVEAYLLQRFGAGFSETVLAPLLHQRTQGHPLFLKMVADDLVRSGHLVEWDGAWTLQSDLAVVMGRVPDTVRQFIEHQLDQVSPEEQMLLEVASVVGAEFSPAAVAAGVDQTVDAIEVGYSAITRRGQFVRERGIEAWPDGTVAPRYGFVHSLYQDVLYARVSPGRRRRLHQQIGTRKERGYGAQAPDIAAELAVHFEGGNDSRRAIRYRWQAGETALRRSAYQEAIIHVTHGLALLQQGLETPEDRTLALHLQAILGAALMATQGYAAPDVAAAYTKARELCQQVGESPKLGSVLRGLRLFYVGRAEYQTAQLLEEQLFEHARREGDPAARAVAHSLRGETWFFEGRFPEARMHAETGLALTAQQQLHPHLQLVSRARLSLILWMLGAVDQALAHSRTALEQARALNHPLTLAGVLGYTALFHQLRRDRVGAQESAAAVLALSAEHDFVYWSAYGMILHGCTVVGQGHYAAGLAQMQQGVAQMHTMGAAVGHSFFLGQLAEAYRQAGQAEEGLHIVMEALAFVDKTGERAYEAALHQLRGALLRMGAGAGETEACFYRALDIARGQQAKMLELQAAMSLARLWQQQDRGAEARQLLAEVYGWFTEGFDTADVQEAKALLDTLAGGVADLDLSIYTPRIYRKL
jgi:DNA-binding winged helix-turn-helix (wHTH) protein/predicted ATPase